MRLSGSAFWIVLTAVVIGCAPSPERAEQELQPLYFPPPPEEPRFVFERSVRGSTDLEQVSTEERMRQMLTGEAEAGKAFSKPFDVAACQGHVFVSDTVRRTVMVFDVPGRRVFEIGREEPGALRKPLGLSTDSECRLYVADGTTRSVMVYDQGGQFVNALGGQQWFERLSHVTVDAAGERVFAVDTGGVNSPDHRVRVFDAQSGEHLYDIGERGTEAGQFNLLRDAEIGPDGTLYVVDGGNFRVQVLDREGNPIRTIGSVGRRYGQFARPKGIAVDGEGNIYVSDAAHGNFQVFDSEGQLLLFVGSRSERGERATYMLPAGIDIDEDGRIYMVDQYFRRLDIFRPASIGAREGYLGGWTLE